MAIAFDAVTSDQVAAPTTALTYAHTASGSDRCAIVGVSYFQDPQPNPTCTYDGASMVQEARITDPSVDGAALFSLAAPSTTTDANVAIASAGDNFGVASGCMTFTGVDQTDPTRGVASASADTVNVTTEVDDWCVDDHSDVNAITPGASQTERYDIGGVSGIFAAGSHETAVGTSTTMSWTGGAGFGSIIAAALVPVGGGGGGGITRQYYSSSATAEATTTATTPLTIATLTYTPDDNNSYALLWSALVRTATGLTIDTQVFLTNNATATIAAYNIEPQDVTTYRSVGGLAFATFATATGAHSFRIKLNGETATGIHNMKEAHLVAIRLTTGDQWFQSTASSANTATTLATVATMSFTPSATGDYLVIASCERLHDIATVVGRVFLNINGTGTDYGTASMTQQDITNFTPWGTAAKISWTATECQTTIITSRATATMGITVRQRRLLALRLSGFQNNDYAESRANVLVTATSTTAGSNSATLAFQPGRTAYNLALYGGITGVQSNAIDGLTQISGTNLGTVLANEEANSATDELVFWGVKLWTSTSTATRTWNISHGLNSTATAGTFRKKEAFISVLDLATVTATAAGAVSTLRTLAATGAGLAWAGAAVLPQVVNLPWAEKKRWVA